MTTRAKEVAPLHTFRLFEGETCEVTAVDYHRNGISGIGFHILQFTMRQGGRKRLMQAIIFPSAPKWDENHNNGYCAVFDVEMATTGNIFMYPRDGFGGGNAWRGDHFEEGLRQAIRIRNKQRDEELGLEKAGQL